MNHANDTVLAVDLGGTLLRAALVRGDGRIAVRREVRTPQEGPELVVRAVAGLAAQLGGAPFVVAVAAPGPLDPTTGVVYATPNLRGFEGFPLADSLAEALGVPTLIHNDANLAALGEWRFGAGQEADPMVFLTISTGVGGGIVRGGRFDEGRHGLAGELGHMIVAPGGPRCRFHHSGCLEAVASGTALAARATEAVAAGESTSISERSAEGAITARVVAEAARLGDAVANQLFTDLGRYLGSAVGSLINALDPEAVVIGGGVSQAWDLFGPALSGAAREVVMSPEGRPHLRIVPGELPGDAGLVGAAVWARHLMREGD